MRATCFVVWKLVGKVKKKEKNLMKIHIRIMAIKKLWKRLNKLCIMSKQMECNKRLIIIECDRSMIKCVTGHCYDCIAYICIILTIFPIWSINTISYVYSVQCTNMLLRAVCPDHFNSDVNCDKLHYVNFFFVVLWLKKNNKKSSAVLCWLWTLKHLSIDFFFLLEFCNFNFEVKSNG